jgi:hypothetical protein
MYRLNLFAPATLPLPMSISRSVLRRRFLVGALAVAFLCFGLWQTAQGQDGDYGRGNTAEGSDALHTYITNPTNTASDNTAIGDGALSFDTPGSGNTATGDGALGVNTTGNNNTANGLFALESNTTGNQNTASGSGALNLNTAEADRTPHRDCTESERPGRPQQTCTTVSRQPLNSLVLQNLKSAGPGNGCAHAGTGAPKISLKSVRSVQPLRRKLCS